MIDFIREAPGLSRRKQGFETPTGRQDFQRFFPQPLHRTNSGTNI